MSERLTPRQRNSTVLEIKEEIAQLKAGKAITFGGEYDVECLTEEIERLRAKEPSLAPELDALLVELGTVDSSLSILKAKEPLQLTTVEARSLVDKNNLTDGLYMIRNTIREEAYMVVENGTVRRDQIFAPPMHKMSYYTASPDLRFEGVIQMKQQIKVDIIGISHINDVATKLVAAFAKNEDCVVFCEFSGITLECDNNNTTAPEITMFYLQELDRREEKRCNSPEGKKVAAELEENFLAYQKEAGELINLLPSLDFTSLSDVLKWWKDFGSCVQHNRVTCDKQKVVDLFKAKGFQPNVNISDDLNTEDAEYYARYIIGQCLHDLERLGTVHQVIGVWADGWNFLHGESEMQDK